MHGVVLLLFLAWTGIASAGDELIHQARAASAAAAGSLKKVVTAQDMALLAAQNALAERRALETEILSALKSSDRDRVRRLKEALKKAFAESEQTLDVVERISVLVGEAARAASSAAAEAERATGPGSAKESMNAARNAGRHAKTARKAAERSNALVEPVKRRWLIPLPSSRSETNASERVGAREPLPGGGNDFQPAPGRYVRLPR